DGNAGPIDDAPKVRFEEPSAVLVAEVFDPSPDRGTGIVDPGVEAAEASDRGVGDSLDVLQPADVGDHMRRLSAAGNNLAFEFSQRLAVTRREHDPGAEDSGRSCRSEADAARRPGDDEHLLVDRRQSGCHTRTSSRVPRTD